MKKKRFTAFLMAGAMLCSAVGTGTPAAAENASAPTANPVISRNCPAYSANSQYGASQANDEHYFSFWSSPTPDYLAYDLSAVPAEQRRQVIAVWYTTSSYDQLGSYAMRNMEPSDYTVEVNKAEGGEYPESGWEVVETVSDNILGSRQHLVDMEGYNWIRLNLSKADGEAGKSASINFDIHNVSDGVWDSWLFLGDSITAGGMNNCYGTGFATYVNQLDPRFFPIQENGGIGGIRSSDGRENIDRWLSTCCAKFVSIAYGTNDAWGNGAGSASYYENTKYMIDAILAAGKTPVLPKIPYSTNPDVNAYLDEYNGKVDQLYEEYGDKLVHGPDFDEFFRNDPSGLSGDGVHPNSEGYDAMRKLWAETMYKNVYTAESTPPETTTGTQPDADIMYGDANVDGKVSVADVVLIMQVMANPGNYSLTEQGAKNSDCTGDLDGVTSRDALVVQQYLLRQISVLPLNYNEPITEKNTETASK